MIFPKLTQFLGGVNLDMDNIFGDVTYSDVFSNDVTKSIAGVSCVVAFSASYATTNTLISIERLAATVSDC